jgi:hypothetical protein
MDIIYQISSSARRMGEAKQHRVDSFIHHTYLTDAATQPTTQPPTPTSDTYIQPHHQKPSPKATKSQKNWPWIVVTRSYVAESNQLPQLLPCISCIWLPTRLCVLLFFSAIPSFPSLTRLAQIVILPRHNERAKLYLHSPAHISQSPPHTPRSVYFLSP